MHAQWKVERREFNMSQEYHFRPDETQWQQIQYYLQDLVADVIKNRALDGMEAEEFSRLLYTFADLFSVLDDRDQKMLAKER